jgi:hypothetical protein
MDAAALGLKRIWVQQFVWEDLSDPATVELGQVIRRFPNRPGRHIGCRRSAFSTATVRAHQSVLAIALSPQLR